MVGFRHQRAEVFWGWWVFLVTLRSDLFCLPTKMSPSQHKVFASAVPLAKTLPLIPIALSS